MRNARKRQRNFIEAGNYFRQRNYGKAVTLFEEALKAFPSADTYYYIALCYQEMKEDEKALKYLKEGVEKFPKDSTLQNPSVLCITRRAGMPRQRRRLKKCLGSAPATDR